MEFSVIKITSLEVLDFTTASSWKPTKKHPYLEQIRLGRLLNGRQLWETPKSEKLPVEMEYISIKLKLELLTKQNKKAVQVLEEMEEIPIHGQFLTVNTLPKSFIEMELGLIVSPLWQMREPNHLNLVEMEEEDLLSMFCHQEQDWMAFMVSMINMLEVLDSTTVSSRKSFWKRHLNSETQIWEMLSNGKLHWRMQKSDKFQEDKDSTLIKSK